MVDSCTWAAGERGVDVDALVETFFRGYSIKPSSPRRWRWPGRPSRAVASSRCETSTGGGSDANALRAAGFDALLLANGTEANHTPDESVAASELIRMRELCSAIVAGA